MHAVSWLRIDETLLPSESTAQVDSPDKQPINQEDLLHAVLATVHRQDDRHASLVGANDVRSAVGRLLYPVTFVCFHLAEPGAQTAIFASPLRNTCKPRMPAAMRTNYSLPTVGLTADEAGVSSGLSDLTCARLEAARVSRG